MDIAEVRGALRLDPNKLDQALETNAAVMEEIGREVAKRSRRSTEAKRDMEALEARITADLKADDPKMTNPNAEREVRRDKEWVKAWQHYLDVKQEHEEWVSASEAWKTRSYDLKTFAALYSSQYFTTTTISAEDLDGRRRMREASQEANVRPRRRSIVDS